MANTTVSILIRFGKGKNRKTVAAAYAGKARLKPGIGRDKKRREFPCPGGIYWLRWYNGPKQEWRRVGPDAHDALTAQMRQEDRLAGVTLPQEQSSPTSRGTLAESIEEFVRERRDMNPDSVDRWEKELALFQRLASSKTYLHELGRSDVFAYRKWYKDHGRSDNTVALRTSSLLTFGKRFGVLYDLFTKEERDNLPIAWHFYQSCCGTLTDSPGQPSTC